MKLPTLSEEELQQFLQGAWIAKLGTINIDGTVRMTPIWYEYQNGPIVMSTPENTAHIENLKRNKKCSLLIDSTEWPTKGVHFYGRVDLDHGSHAADPEKIAKMWTKYYGSFEKAYNHAKMVVNLGKRVFIVFYPEKKVTWDFT